MRVNLQHKTNIIKIYSYEKLIHHYCSQPLLSTGNCKIINLSEENILWGFKI